MGSHDRNALLHSAILAFTHMEVEVSTASCAVTDALGILSNLRPSFTRKFIPQINSTAVSAVRQTTGIVR